MRAWSSGLMPIPVSVTDTRRSGPAGASSAIDARVVTAPPGLVNLMALLSRLYMICLNFGRSAVTVGRSGGTRKVSSIPFLMASVFTITWTSRSASAMSNGPGSSVMRPASTFERSRMSLINRSR
jgi:hypothetical protein